MMEDLTHYIYIKSSNGVLQWKHTASSQIPFQRNSSGRNSSGQASNGQGKSEMIKVKSLTLEVVGSSSSMYTIYFILTFLSISLNVYLDSFAGVMKIICNVLTLFSVLLY